MKTTTPYKKYIYWLDPSIHSEAIAEFNNDKKRIHKAKNFPCEALYQRRETVLVKPETWNLRCNRQGSWYRASHRKGQYLLTSNSLLDGFNHIGTVTLAAFSPPQTATATDVLEMISQPAAREIVPEGWGLFTTWEPAAIQALLLKEGKTLSLQEVYSYYTANHLNFITPKFFLTEKDNPIIPYSINGTALVCSACVEIFGILGTAYPKMYLAPCPGLKYIKFQKGEYICVSKNTDYK